MYKTMLITKRLAIPSFAVASSYWIYKNTLSDKLIAFEASTPEKDLVGTVDYVFDKFTRNKKLIYGDKDTLPGFKPYEGIMTASLTAMSKDGMTVDLSQVEKYANDLVEQRVTGVFVNGTSGQSVSLTIEERKQILEAWMNTKAVKSGKLTIIPHIGSNSMLETLELTDHAVSLGVFAIGVMPPSYFKPGNAKQAAELCIHVAQRHPTVPVYYYHIPSMTGVNVSCCDT